MKVEIHPSFKKAYKKRIVPYPELTAETARRIGLFRLDATNPILKDHSLIGKKRELKSFSVTGDIRIVYFPVSYGHVIFLDIGSHNQVY